MPLLKGILGQSRISNSLLRLLAGSQVLLLAFSSAACLSASAQGLPGAPAGNTASAPPQIAQLGSTVLPTDVLPLPAAQERMSTGENLQLRILQRLPAPFYFNASCETSFRFETNPFQFPNKRTVVHELENVNFGGPLVPIQQEPLTTYLQDLQTIQHSDSQDNVYRVMPNLTAGWAFTPRTRFYGNWFLIRDQLAKNTRLNTVIQSISYGIQHDFPVGRRGNLQADFQARELFQLHSQRVFDFLPGLTFSYLIKPNLVGYVNALAQMRGKQYFQAPVKELDPFYTWGGIYSKGQWAFTATTTFVQNFREPFRHEATIPANNYSFISDFEIARRFIRQLPGLQAFIRAEPIWNFHSHNRFGLSGQDFRLFYGLRLALGKPPLTAALQQIRQQLEEQESAPPPAAPPSKQPSEPKPSAFIMPYQLTASNPQPIHGLIPTTVAQHQSGSDDPVALAALHGPVSGNVRLADNATIAFSVPSPATAKPPKTPSKWDALCGMSVPGVAMAGAPAASHFKRAVAGKPAKQDGPRQVESKPQIAKSDTEGATRARQEAARLASSKAEAKKREQQLAAEKDAVRKRAQQLAEEKAAEIKREAQLALQRAESRKQLALIAADQRKREAQLAQQKLEAKKQAAAEAKKREAQLAQEKLEQKKQAALLAAEAKKRELQLAADAKQKQAQLAAEQSKAAKQQSMAKAAAAKPAQIKEAEKPASDKPSSAVAQSLKAEQIVAQIKKTPVKKPETKKNRPEIATAKDIQMILMPPLPTVQVDSKEPFKNSGIDVKPPAVPLVIR